MDWDQNAQSTHFYTEFDGIKKEEQESKAEDMKNDVPPPLSPIPSTSHQTDRPVSTDIMTLQQFCAQMGDDDWFILNNQIRNAPQLVAVYALREQDFRPLKNQIERIKNDFMKTCEKISGQQEKRAKENKDRLASNFQKLARHLFPDKPIQHVTSALISAKLEQRTKSELIELSKTLGLSLTVSTSLANYKKKKIIETLLS